MALTDIKQLLPRDSYNAIVGANTPSASNVFATMLDLSASSSIYTANGTLTSNRTVTQNNKQLNFFGNGTVLNTYTQIYIWPDGANAGIYFYTGNNFGNGSMVQVDQSASGDYFITSEHTNQTQKRLSLQSSSIRLDYYNNVSGENNSIELNDNGFEIRTTLGKGAYYIANYSATGIAAHGDRWIPDVGYVKANSGIYGGSGTVPTSTVATLTDSIQFGSAYINNFRTIIGATSTLSAATLVVKGISNSSTTNFAVYGGTLSGRTDFSVSVNNPNIAMYDSAGVQQVNFDSGSSSSWILRPFGVNMVGGTARLSVKALSNGTDQAFRIRNNTDASNLMIVQGNGSVGIGVSTINASVKLEVAGSVWSKDKTQVGQGTVWSGISHLTVDGGGSTSVQLIEAKNNAGTFFAVASRGVGSFGSGLVGTAMLTVTTVSQTTNSVEAGLKVLNDRLSSSTVPRYGAYIEATGSGTTKYNVGLYVRAINNTIANYSILVPAGGGNAGFGTLNPTSMLTVNGDIETLGNTNGLIVLDRTDGNRYRIYTDGGVLNTELV